MWFCEYILVLSYFVYITLEMSKTKLNNSIKQYKWKTDDHIRRSIVSSKRSVSIKIISSFNDIAVHKKHKLTYVKEIKTILAYSLKDQSTQFISLTDPENLKINRVNIVLKIIQVFLDVF